MFVKLHKLDLGSTDHLVILKGQERGVYYTNDLNFEHHLDTWTNYKIAPPYSPETMDALSVQSDHQYGDGYRSGYGLSDNAQQVLDHYRHLSDRKGQYVVILTPIYRENQSSWGGFRFHKWGEYIGTHDLTCEYLYDQTDIDVIFVYHVYHIIGTKPRPSHLKNRIRKINVRKQNQQFMKRYYNKNPKRAISHTTYLKKKGR